MNRDDIIRMAQQALDALAGYRREMNLIRGESYMHGQPCDAEIALRAALEQAEPAATFAENATTQQQIEQTPPSEYRRGYWAGFAIGKREGRIEAEDELAQQAEPAQKPVAWMCPDDPERETAFHWQAGHCDNCGKQRIPLYTAPPQRPPLTDEEIDALAMDEDGLPNSHLEFARAIERAHGIGEEV